MSHPRDRFITLFGRKPVLAALEDRDLAVEKVLVARGAKGPVVRAILDAARARGLTVQRADAKAVTRLSRNGRQDQGVVADVVAPRMAALEAALPGLPARCRVLVLDGVTTPANVGLILRSATAAGMHGVVLPRRGCPEVGPLVIKASAGIAFRAPILRAPDSPSAVRDLAAAGFTICGLRGRDAEDLYTAALPERTAWVLGNETIGVSAAVGAAVDRWLRVPMANGVESLNVANAAAVIAFELARRSMK